MTHGAFKCGINDSQRSSFELTWNVLKSDTSRASLDDHLKQGYDGPYQVTRFQVCTSNHVSFPAKQKEVQWLSTVDRYNDYQQLTQKMKKSINVQCRQTCWYIVPKPQQYLGGSSTTENHLGQDIQLTCLSHMNCKRGYPNQLWHNTVHWKIDCSVRTLLL